MSAICDTCLGWIYRELMKENLIFFIDELRVLNLRLCPPLCGCDHSVIIFDYKIAPLYMKNSKVMYIYEKQMKLTFLEF